MGEWDAFPDEREVFRRDDTEGDVFANLCE